MIRLVGGFVLKCLKAKGFNSTWCEWMENILHNGTMVVKLNGQMGPYF
jgi:hypothetical protein